MRSAFAPITAFVLIAFVPGIRADEQKVPLKDVPKAVLDAVKAKFPHADLKEAAKEKEDDETIFEITIVDQGKHIDVSVDDEGEIEKTETEIAVADLPKAVVVAITAKYPKATIKSAEHIVEFEDGKADEESFEVVITEGKKNLEVVVSPGGKILEEESKDAEKD